MKTTEKARERKLTKNQQEVVDACAAGARVEHRIWTKVSGRGNSISMRRCERYDLVVGQKSTKKLTAGAVDTLARRGLIKVHSIGGDNPIREFVEAVKTNDDERAHRAIDAGVRSFVESKKDAR